MFLGAGSRCIREAICSSAPVVLALTNCQHTKLIIRACAFLEGWHVVIREAGPPEDSEIRAASVVLLDLDSFDRDWRQELAQIASVRTCLALTAHMSDENFLRALALGARQLLPKPITGPALAEAVRFATSFDSTRGAASYAVMRE